MKSLAILGTRGIPARHGGFETFAEQLSLHLVERGWRVTVYCQEEGGENCADHWRGVGLRHLVSSRPGAWGSIGFDWHSMIEACGERQLLLTLGYNTGLFGAVSRFRSRVNLYNMDGYEWKRAKWSPAIRKWFWVNDHLACRLGNHLIADHPAIADHLATRVARSKITMIPYGAPRIREAPEADLPAGLKPGSYALVVARAEPENSILEIVRAFSARRRDHSLVVLGRYGDTAYQARVMAAAGPQVVFLGAIYDKDALAALRFHARLYVHGHRVGGTNPSLVEALGAGNAVLAHDNRFNRWVAGEGAAYFTDEAACAQAFDRLLGDDAAVTAMGRASVVRHAQDFTCAQVLAAYEALLDRWWEEV